MMNCKQATRLLSERMERDLNRRERLGLKLHVMLCRGCRNFGHQMRSLRDLAQSYAKGRAAPDDGPDEQVTSPSDARDKAPDGGQR